MYITLLILLLIINFKLELIEGSKGDQLAPFRSCLYSCFEKECDVGGYSYLNNEESNIFSYIKWPCYDECKYDCMWNTVDILEYENLTVPQFYGKWPFIRFFGIQEPASTFFSLWNFMLHIYWLKVYRWKVSSQSPLYWLWHVFGLVCLNAWFWSVLFHAKETQLTEFMDYAGAFSIILINCYLMVIRLTFKFGKVYCTLISLIFLLFYLNHSLYLYSSSRIDYNYNMVLNFSIGIITVISWLLWCYTNRITKPYVKKCAIYVILTSIVSLLEIIDRPPLFYVFDSHSIWHLSTAFLIGIFYK